MPKSVDTNVQILPSGLILNNAVDLPASPALATDRLYSVNWFSLSNGARLANITDSRQTADSSLLSMLTYAESNTANTQTGIIAGAIATPAGFSQVSAQADDPVNPLVAPVIIRSDGASSFVQNVTLAKRYQGRGLSAAVSFVASTTASLVVNHGLPVTPASVQLCPNGNVGVPLGQPLQIYAQTFTATQFTIFVATNVATTGDLFFSWTANS